MGLCSAKEAGPRVAPIGGENKMEEKKSEPGKSEVIDHMSDYQISNTILGSGHFAEVRKCIHRPTKREYAVKIIGKEQTKNSELVMQEIRILQQIGEHPNVIPLLDVFQDKNNFYLVMAFCEGGDLFTRITQEGPYSERTAAICVSQLASALHYIHSKGVIHRDLKPENILLKDKHKDSALQVCDFGLSTIIKTPEDKMKTICGTWAYCAPEVICRKAYDKAVDYWTLGVLMYILLAGYHPFDVYGDLPEPHLCQNIKACKYDFEDEAWSGVSKEAIHIIQGLLRKDPKKRLNMQAVLKSKWVSKASDTQRTDVLLRLRSFHKSRRTLRGLVLAKVVGARLRRKQIRRRLLKANAKFVEDTLTPIVE